MNINSAAADAASAPLSAPPHIVKRLSVLPPCARAKYERLRRSAQRARAVVDGLQTEIDRVREARASAMRDLALHDRRYPPQELIKDGKRVDVPDPARDELAAIADDLTRELARLQDEARSVIVPDVVRIEDWLRQQEPGAKFAPALVALPKLGKGETVAAALERIIEDQRRIADELATVRNSPRTRAEARASIRGQIDALAARGRPDVAPLFSGGTIAWPTEQFIAGGHGAHQHFVTATVNDMLALFAWTHRDAVVAALDRELEAQGSDDAYALTAEDQASRIAQLEANLLQLQRQAEALIERLEGDGVAVRRTCLIPEVLLGIERAN